MMANVPQVALVVQAERLVLRLSRACRARPEDYERIRRLMARASARADRRHASLMEQVRGIENEREPGA